MATFTQDTQPYGGPATDAGKCSPGCRGWQPGDRGIERCDECAHIQGRADTYQDDDAERDAAAAIIAFLTPHGDAVDVLHALVSTEWGRDALAAAADGCPPENPPTRPMLCDYSSGEEIRFATAAEARASLAAAEHDGGSGVIVVDACHCFVADTEAIVMSTPIAVTPARPGRKRKPKPKKRDNP